MKVADVLGAGVTSWRDVHAALTPHNERGDPTAGHLFEEFAKHFFLAAPEYKGDFKNVWSEAEIPSRIRKKLTLASRDHGVDLLLEDHEGRFHAVQCKFKTNESTTLGWTKDRLSSWLAESDEAQGLIMFTNASGIDTQSTLKAGKKDFTLITVGDLVSLSAETIENIVRRARGRAPKKPKRFKPHAYQRRAINDVVKGFKTHDRGQLILPCGAGKTLTALWLKERMGVKRTLVLVPSLALLRQMRQDWAAQQKERLPYLCVCSEKDIDKDKRDAIVTHTFEVPGHVTTQPDEIRAFARKHRELVVYSTYQSLQAVVDAGVKFNLAICDEAHKTATARHNEFALIHDDKVKVEKRLYMTATPRVLSYQAKNALGEDAFTAIADMSDEETFGPEFHRMGFGEAIDEGILSDYKIVVVGVTDRQVHKHIEERTYLEDASADQVATSLALQKAMKKHGAAHALTFHSNIKRAKAFKDIHDKRVRRTEVEHVNGSMSTNDRLVLLDEFRDAPHAVLTNARCLTEGVDVPAIDCVAFVDPRHSKVDIVQAAGRALRIGDGTKAYGVILIPLFYEVGEDPEEIASTGVFKNVYEVVRAMADQDERLQAEITSILLGEGKRGASKSRLIIEPGDEERLVLEGFEKRLKAALVERVVERTLGTWEVSFAELAKFKEEHGHCDVPTYLGGRGSPRNRLGVWVSDQRSRRRKGTLSPARVARLSALGLVWDVREADWEDKFADLVAFKEKHGHCWVPGAGARPRNELAVWVAALRHRPDRLSPERKRRLDEIGFEWAPEEESRDWLTSKEFGEIFGVSRGTVNRWAKKGLIATEERPSRPGVRIHRSQVDNIVRHYGLTHLAGEWEGKFLSTEELAAKSGVATGTIHVFIGNGRVKPVGRACSPRGVIYLFPLNERVSVRDQRGEHNPLSKLTAEQALAIYRDSRPGAAIARAYDVTRQAVYAIKKGKTWAQVTGHKAGAKK